MSALTDLYDEIALCHQCDIAKSRTNVVPGEGAEDADVMFIGEAPGFHEDRQGRPFIGPAGKFLDELLASINLDRKKIYIANVIKCRPTGNRDPLPVEISNCRRWLDRQLEIIKPKMIVTLGRFSMSMYFEGQTISKVHGTATRKDGLLCFAMYHPAAALHQQSLREVLKQDILRIPALIEKEIQAQKVQAAEVRQEPQQLTMFDL